MRKNAIIISLAAILTIFLGASWVSQPQTQAVSHVNIIYSPSLRTVYVADGTNDMQTFVHEKKEDGEKLTVSVLNEWGAKGYQVVSSSSINYNTAIIQRHYTLAKIE